MRTTFMLLVLLTATASAAQDVPAPQPAPVKVAPAAPAPAPAPMPIFPSVQIDIEPGSDSGTFVATARVFDLNSRKILAGPQLNFQQGQPASTEVDGPDGSFKVKIEVGVDATGSSAQWSFSITEQGVLIADSRGTVTLTRPRDVGY